MKTVDISQWLEEAKRDPAAEQCGMYLIHNGVVRRSPKQQVRAGVNGLPPVKQLRLSCNADLLQQAIDAAYGYPGVHYVRAWVNEGLLDVGDTMMYVLVGADIRPNCINALEKLVGEIKTHVVTEEEIFEESGSPSAE